MLEPSPSLVFGFFKDFVDRSTVVGRILRHSDNRPDASNNLNCANRWSDVYSFAAVAVFENIALPGGPLPCFVAGTELLKKNGDTEYDNEDD